jgi:uncharacterized cupin superfamily protein
MSALKSPALDPMTMESVARTNYPAAFHHLVAGRSRRRIGDALGLTNFGVNLTTLLPGAHSAIRHWHEAQDEFIYVVSGTLTLVTNVGEQKLTPGMCAGFPKGKEDGHKLVNKSDAPAMYLEVGDRAMPDMGHYPDDDLAIKRGDKPGQFSYVHKDGTPY